MPAAQSPSVWADWAGACFEAITASRRFSARRKLFGERGWLVWHRYETLWPFAGAWSAVGTLASLGGRTGARSLLPALLDGLPAYHRSPAAVTGTGPLGFESVVVPPLGSGGDVYYDDNAWLGLALAYHHDLLGDERSLLLARRLFEHEVSGWSRQQGWSHPGGIRWKQPLSNASRNTCSNAPSAELGVVVHRHGADADADALEWAVRIYHWLRSTLLGSDDLYLDRIGPDGTCRPDIWTYNQGAMIGAGVLLSEATGNLEYRAHAEATAAASLERFDVARLVGRNGPAFNAVYFRNLLLLDRVVPNPAYRALAADYGEEMWAHHRDGRTGLLRAGGSPVSSSAPMVEIYALLAGAPPHP